MTSKRTSGIIFISSLLLMILSVSWLIFNTDDIGLILTEIMHQFVLIMAWLSFFITALSLRKLLLYIQYETNERKEKNVRDFHQYTKLLNPPFINN